MRPRYTEEEEAFLVLLKLLAVAKFQAECVEQYFLREKNLNTSPIVGFVIEDKVHFSAVKP